jgi:hypothetical protein
MWLWVVFVIVVALIGGCAIVMGSGSASLRVDRKVEVGSDNEATMHKEVEVKDKKQ